MSLPEALEPSGDANQATAIYIAVLAVILAICSLGDDDATKTMIRSSIEVTDTWSFFQAKNIRQTSYELAASELEISLKGPGVTSDQQKFAEEKIKFYRATAKRYESEPETGDGKKELREKAKRLEAERDLALKRDPYFDLGGAFLQIAIVLASVAIILGGGILLWASGLLAFIGTLATINAFTLLVEVSFL